MLLNLVEGLVGRRRMWKIGRRLYLHARREGSLDFDHNGEKVLQAALVRRSVESGKGLRILDVGANHGQWSGSLLAAIAEARAPRARMTLFEPVAGIRQSLERLRDRYVNAADIEIVPRAVSDAAGSATMIVTVMEAGNHHLSSANHALEGDKVEVEVTTLDLYDAAAPSDHVDMVKIDAEGFDPLVVRGMRGMLKAGKVDVVQIEYSVLFIRSRSYLADIFDVAAESGYSVALLTNAGFEVHAEWHPDLEHFYPSAVVMLHERALALLPARHVVYGGDNAHD